MTDKIEWMLTELHADGFTEAEESDIYNIFAEPDYDRYRPDFIELIEELDQEWEQSL